MLNRYFTFKFLLYIFPASKQLIAISPKLIHRRAAARRHLKSNRSASFSVLLYIDTRILAVFPDPMLDVPVGKGKIAAVAVTIGGQRIVDVCFSCHRIVMAVNMARLPYRP
jgi:hypothetical protein